MARTCTVCRHGDRPAVDQALINHKPYRHIAGQFGLSTSALVRHHDTCLPELLATAQAAREEALAIDLMAELHRCVTRVNLLFDACDRWLRDPDDATRYDVGPRADDVKVTYLELVGEKSKPVLKKAPLAELLARLEDGGTNVQRSEYKHADPRELVLRTSAQLQGHLELLLKLREQQELAARVQALEERLADQKEGGPWKARAI